MLCSYHIKYSFVTIEYLLYVSQPSFSGKLCIKKIRKVHIGLMVEKKGHKAGCLGLCLKEQEKVVNMIRTHCTEIKWNEVVKVIL